LIDICPSNKKNGFANVIMKDKLVKRIKELKALKDMIKYKN